MFLHCYQGRFAPVEAPVICLTVILMEQGSQEVNLDKKSIIGFWMKWLALGKPLEDRLCSSRILLRSNTSDRILSCSV